MKTLKSFLCVAIVLAATALLAVSCNNDDSSSADQKVSYAVQAHLSTQKTGVSMDEVQNAIISYSSKLISSVSNAKSDSEAISKVEAVIEDYKANWSPCSGEVTISKNIGEKSTELKKITF